MPKCCSRTPVWRVSSAAIKDTLCKISRARCERSSKLPIGVATTYSRPAGSIATIIFAFSIFQERKGMAAILRRPRLPLYAALAVSLTLAACSLLKPEHPPEDKQERALRLGQEGKHTEAAKAYAELADLQPANHDNYELLSAEQSLAASDIAAANQAFAAVSADARVRLPTARALVAAEIAFAENDGARAIQELDQIAVPTSADQAQIFWWIRGRNAFLSGHPVEGTRALVERERWLTDPVSVGANRAEHYSRVRSAAERGQPLSAPPKTDPIVVGWLELGPVAVGLARDPMRAAAALANWKRLFPQHPANASVLAMASNQIAAATEFPDQIALLLPLSGRAEAVGVAVRDGFVAAYLEQDPATRPRLKIYDVAAESVGSTYTRAISEEAGFVVGPLTKEDVAAVVPFTRGNPARQARRVHSSSRVLPHHQAGSTGARGQGRTIPPPHGCVLRIRCCRHRGDCPPDPAAAEISLR